MDTRKGSWRVTIKGRYRDRERLQGAKRSKTA
jgi:hypothetical protein